MKKNKAGEKNRGSAGRKVGLQFSVEWSGKSLWWRDFCTKILRRWRSKPCAYLRESILGRGNSKCKDPEIESCLQCSGKLRRRAEDEVGEGCGWGSVNHIAYCPSKDFEWDRKSSDDLNKGITWSIPCTLPLYQCFPYGLLLLSPGILPGSMIVLVHSSFQPLATTVIQIAVSHLE